MTHQQIHDNDVIEQYVLEKLPPDARQAFQEHYFECDECFEHTTAAARFIAGVRAESRSGVLAPEQTERPGFWNRLTPFYDPRWAMPALAMGLMLAVVLTGLWAVSLRRENQRLAQRTAEQALATERLRGLEKKIQELEAGNDASQEQKESLAREISNLKEQLAAAERQRETQVAQLRQPQLKVRQPEVDVPVRNIYPVGAVERSGGSDDVNRLNVGRGTRKFVLLLGDYKPGYSSYQLELRSPSGKLVTRRAGLKPDKNGELSVLLNRSLLGQGQYRLKLSGGGQPIAEYVVELGQ